MMLEQEGGLADRHALTAIREALRGLRYGSLHIIVQDGKVVQIEKTEKIRLVIHP